MAATTPLLKRILSDGRFVNSQKAEGKAQKQTIPIPLPSALYLLWSRCTISTL